VQEITGRWRSDESRAQGEDSLGGTLSHAEYRALVVREASKSGKKPDAKTFYLSQRRVDAALGKSGTTIEIPGASPGRRTL
jgi:hypothetical protein